MTNVELEFFSSGLELAQKAATDWMTLASGSMSPHLVALSGGRIATTFFAAVTQHARRSQSALANVHFFWADERCVAPDSPDSNFSLANQFLLEPLAIAPGRIHRLKGELDPMEAVTQANREIGRIAPNNAEGMAVLDMIFLGLGENAHIASLMPEAPPHVNDCQDAYVYVDNSPKPPPRRITLTYAAIAAARDVWTLVSGSGKEDALRESLRAGAATPFARMLQSRARSRIFSDIPL
jgi:6-phosphogluconolactonase